MISRLFSAILTILGVSVAVFVLTHVIPGDPVEIMLGEMASAADRQAVAAALAASAATAMAGMGGALRAT